jgi:Na+-transporting NADH:ubiquinone oxidoreductase subunit C
VFLCKRSFTTVWTIFFIFVLSIVSAAVLALLASLLKEKKEEARELDRNLQLLISAKVFHSDGYFLISNGDACIPAKNVGGGVVVPSGKEDVATAKDVAEVYLRRVRPMVVDLSGNLMTYEQAQLHMRSYLEDWRTAQPGSLKYLPLFEILPISGEGAPEVYVIPITGFGLWDRIVGYISILPDGETVRGVAWYDQKETPGLGGTISESSWQQQFTGKKIFQPNEKGVIDIARSPIGITVVKGTVKDMLGKSSKAANSVDGMAGATLTGNGVTRAYKENLGLYRPFFEKLYSEQSHSEGLHPS